MVMMMMVGVVALRCESHTRSILQWDKRGKFSVGETRSSVREQRNQLHLQFWRKKNKSFHFHFHKRASVMNRAREKQTHEELPA